MQLIKHKLLKFWDQGLFFTFFSFKYLQIIHITLIYTLKLFACHFIGWLIGFVSKQDASSQMVKAPHPTFLLRFSDTQTGAVSIGFVCDDEDGKGKSNSIIINIK